MLQRLRDPETRAKIRSITADLIRNERGAGDPRNVVLTRCEWDMALAGKNLSQLTQARGEEPTIENAAETVMWIVEQGGCRGVFHAMSEDDLQRILVHPATMVASDGEVPIFGRGVPHPRSYGTFARMLSVYVREKTAPHARGGRAEDVGVPGRAHRPCRPGRAQRRHEGGHRGVRPGARRDMATFEEPHQYAAGFSHVIVNGQVVYENGAMTAARPGRVLYGSGKK